ncbi:MAG: hypothetical protein ABI835_13595 [Chloroflexota bacterium]
MTDSLDPTDPRYHRAARLLAQKLGVDWRDLPDEQVSDYLRKIEIARSKSPPATPNHPPSDSQSE